MYNHPYLHHKDYYHTHNVSHRPNFLQGAFPEETSNEEINMRPQTQMTSVDNCCGGNSNDDEDFGLNSTFVTNDFCGQSQSPINFDDDFDMLNSSAYENSFFGNMDQNLQSMQRF